LRACKTDVLLLPTHYITHGGCGARGSFVDHGLRRLPQLSLLSVWLDRGIAHVRHLNPSDKHQPLSWGRLGHVSFTEQIL
jgi:hypothetical protein